MPSEKWATPRSSIQRYIWASVARDESGAGTPRRAPPPDSSSKSYRTTGRERKGRRERLRRLLFLFLLRGGRRVVLRGLGDAFLEFLDARPQRPCQLRQPVGAEEDQHDHEDDQ